MDIARIKNAFWRRTAMFAWLPVGFLLLLLVEPSYSAGRTLWKNIRSLRGFPNEWVQTWG